MRKRMLAGLLCLCVLLSAIPLTVLAAEPVTGTVYGINEGNKLYVRKEPSTSANVLDKLFNGDVVTILETKKTTDRTWYKVVTHNNITGWSSADYIKINVSYKTDEEFEAYLTAQKFPESYKPALRQLFAEHPNWVFTAQHLPMTWEKALAEESKALKNAITKPDAWKSMEYGAYNWKTGEYVEVDSGGWVTASPALVAYFMDPRNFLDSTYLFQFEDLRYSDAQTVEGVKAILPSRFDQYAEDLLKASKETRVSAYFLATRMRQEGSKIDGTFAGYEGYYNFFNYGAYAHSGNGAVTNGAIYAKNQGWSTPYKCLLGSAEKIGNSYINKEQNTLYYQKFDVTDGGNGFYSHQYMTNVQAPSSEGAIRAGSATKEELASALTFIIPVYQKMPDTVAPKPGQTGNNNNFLDSITVSGCKLTPTFDRYTMEYAAQVEGKVTEVEITAVLNNKSAQITGTGKVKLAPGDNEIPLTVTATSGQTRTYVLTITRDAPPEPPPEGEEPPAEKKPQITGTVYAVGDTVTRVEPGTSVEQFMKHLAVADGQARVYTADGAEKAEGTIATGDVLHLYSGETLHSSYAVVIYGDVNGDGKINSQDLRKAQRHILSVAAIKESYLLAADANMDGKINSQDLRKIQRHILGLTDSLQPKGTTTNTAGEETTTAVSSTSA